MGRTYSTLIMTLHKDSFHCVDWSSSVLYIFCIYVLQSLAQIQCESNIKQSSSQYDHKTINLYTSRLKGTFCKNQDTWLCFCDTLCVLVFTILKLAQQLYEGRTKERGREDNETLFK